MDFIHKIFCKHDSTLEGSEIKSYKRQDPSEPCYIVERIRYEKYRCKKCGKIKYKIL